MKAHLLKIGQVLEILRPEFPSIELSKIRYYEEQGLVNPIRSDKGYRLFDEVNIECLRQAIRLVQQDFIPLKIVRQRLIEKGLLPDESVVKIGRQAAKVSPVGAVSLVVPESQPRLRTVTEMAPRPASSLGSGELVVESDALARTGLSQVSLAELVSYGFVVPTTRGTQRFYAHLDIEVMHRFAALFFRGVEARHLAVLKRVVERELDLVASLTEPIRLSRSLSTSDVAEQVAAVSDEVGALRAALTSSLERGTRRH
jgi:DNA-binding transcriptional MerR regulator